ncbi:MAG: peptidyl-tRNA hydrolase, family [Chloroflexota bacterium]|nr:peptidyl-tRNA hydrolase, family [Chloroflexota bacterium]
MSFRRRAAEPLAAVEALVVGLGNPGSSYSGTRHNIGFRAADALAKRLNTTVTTKDSKALVGRARVPGESADVVIVKPQTFMNLSGRAVAPLLRKHGVAPQDLWVIHDDIDLPFGRLRIRRGGGAGGHNGISSIFQDVADRDFVRIRMGVGRPDPSEAVEYVLDAFPETERERLSAFVDLAVEAVVTGLVEGLDTSMNRFNGKSI